MDRRHLKQIKSLINEIGSLKIEGADKPDLPALTIIYEAWYSKSLRIVQNLIPERLEDFVSAYKHSRSSPVNFINYSIQDFLMGFKVDHPSEQDYGLVLVKRLILRQVGILSSALKDRPVPESFSEFMSQKDFYSEVLDQAQKLFEMNKPAPASVLAAAVLENYLRWRWRRRNIRVNEQRRSLMEINDILFKFRTYNQSIWVRIQGLIRVAEACLDPQEKAPPKREIGSFIADVRKVVGSSGL